MRFDVLTLFPEVIDLYASTSIVGRAQKEKHIQVSAWNIRDYATDKHRTVDDTPYGGGAGMVMKVEPIDRTLQAIQDDLQASSSKLQTKTVVLSARGEQFTQAKAEEYARLDQLILICGRYEGIDQRVIDHLADEELSAGPYGLAGGELPALTVLEATARLIPGVLGNPDSLEDSVSSLPSETSPTARQNWAQYTKPAEYKGWKVPDVLLSGNHGQVEEWRKQQRRGSVKT